MGVIFQEYWGKAARQALGKRDFERWSAMFVKIAIGEEITEDEKKTRAYRLITAQEIELLLDKYRANYDRKVARTLQKNEQNASKNEGHFVENQKLDDGKGKESKGKERKVKESNIERENRERLTPTLDEVKELCKKENYDFDPVKFFNHYESYGWKVNGQQLIDWKAMAAKWQATQQEYNNNNKKTNNYGREQQQRDKFNDGFSGKYTADQETIHI